VSSPGTIVVEAMTSFAPPGRSLDPAFKRIDVNGTTNGLSSFAVTAEAYAGLQARLDELGCELDELRRRGAVLSAGFQHLDQQMRLASQVQRDMLPRPMPEIAGARVHTLFRPADHVSGDIYNVSRLDETRVALSVADATGHGVAAALLTVFIKQSLRGKEIYGGSYRLVPPIEALERLNLDLVETNLSEGQFVTVVYAVFDETSRRLTWSRGGAPYPTLIRPGQAPRPIQSRGPLVGAFAETKFDEVHVDLEPGDTVLFHTDGLESLLLERDSGGGAGSPTHCDFADTRWFQELGWRPITTSLAEISDLLDHTSPSDWPVDDVTLLAIGVD